MNATPRFRLFDSRRGRGDGIDQEEGAGQTLPRRRMVTSVSVARARRRNRRRPGTTHRGLALVPRLLSLAGATNSRRRRTVFLLLLAVCAAGALVSSRLVAWAVSSRSSSSSSLSSSTPFSPLRPPRHAPASGGASSGGVGGNAHSPREDQKRRRSAVSLGPDAIPSVVLVEHRPAGGARKASSLDAVAGQGGEMEEAKGDSQSPHRCLNTAQGAVLLADSEGRVCRRSDVDVAYRQGCCAARPPPLLGGAGTGDDDNAIAAPEESFVDRGIAASLSATASAGAGAIRRGRALELVVLPPLTTRGGAAASAAKSQPGGDSIGEAGLFPPEQALSTPFSCWSCDEGGGDGGSYSSCCRSYEFCVSCCQAPWREGEREAIREAAARAGHPVYRELGLTSDGRAAAADLYRQKSPLHHQLLRGADLDGSQKEDEEGEEEEREHQARKTREAAFAHCAFRCRTYSGSVAHENAYRGPLKHCFGRFRPPVAGGAQGQAMMPAGGEGGVVRNGGGGGHGAPPLELDPFLAGLA